MTQVSVIIPTVGRPHLQAVLAALEDQYDRAAGLLEVVVSFDVARSPEQAIPQACDPRRMAVRVLAVTARTGVSGARNRGAGAASGDLLLFLDEDVIPRPGWLSAMRAAPWCGGLVLGQITSNWSGRALDQLRFLRYEQRHCVNSLPASEATDGMPCDGPWLSYVSGGNFGITSSLFSQLGGFDPAIAVGQDRDLAARAISNGAHIHYAGDAIGQHINDGNWVSFVCGRFQSGITAGRYGAVHASPDRTFAGYERYRRTPRALLAAYASDLSYEMGRFAARRKRIKNTRIGGGERDDSADFHYAGEVFPSLRLFDVNTSPVEPILTGRGDGHRLPGGRGLLAPRGARRLPALPVGRIPRVCPAERAGEQGGSYPRR